ncbi:beta/gamma crystallin-related protein [Undibacterium sp. RuRC25W]|uniref:beta/gamma crystallin-related protein n=1 Tax=Undibacterium sp. RuRC25W TaxID=3413047 RepID=UPI003BF39621
MNLLFKSAIVAATLTLSAQAMAQIILYENNGWRGRTFSTAHEVGDLNRYGFNDKASSIIVENGRWEICDNAGFGGKCMILQKGNYPSLSSMGMNDRISSLRPVNDRDHYDNEAPQQTGPAYEYRRRPDEDIFQAQVTSVHAVYGASAQRCWTERQQTNEPSHNNVGGAIVGGILGGVLGHQIGGGSGRDIATAGGAVAGAVLGSNVGDNSGSHNSRDVQRCQTVPNREPDSWDVTYSFRGYEHHIQTRYAPGSTISVNHNGEPRQ